MGIVDVWSATEKIAQLLRGSPQLVGLQRVFDHEGRVEAPNPGERALSELIATLGMLGTRPLLVGLYGAVLPPLPPEMPGPAYEQLLRIPEFQMLMDDAAAAADTLLSLIEHLRSRLRGYPDLPVPSLRPQAPAVELDGLLGTGMPWPSALRQRGAAASGPPPAGLQGIADEGWAETAAALAAALEHAAPWQSFVAADAALTDHARGELQAACDEFDQRTSHDRLNDDVGMRLISRVEFTRAALATVTDNLSVPARAYLAAFDEVDRFISQVGMVISDRSIYESPIHVPSEADVSWHRDAQTIFVNARFGEASPFVRPGRLFVYRGGPPLRGAWIGTATTMKLDFAGGGMQVGLDATVLPDSEVFVEMAAPEEAEPEQG